MIEIAGPRDMKPVKEIWKVCFGDEDGFIRFFLKEHLPLGRCLIDREGGRIVSMLFLLPMRAFFQGGERGAQYVYAAATLPAFRRGGRMAALLDFAHRQAVEKGLLFTCLKPANEKLYRYYGRLGYQTAFHITHRFFAAEPEEKTPPLKKADAETVFRQREETFPVSVLWDAELFDFALREWKQEGGDCLAFPGGYCLAKANGENVLCKEAVPGPWPLEALASALCRRYGGKAAEFCLPWDGLSSSDGGMLRPASADLDIGAFIASRPYFNLMLD